MSKLERRLLHRVSRASRDFAMIEPNDRVMACVSGGKDSLGMLRLLSLLQVKVPFSFSLVAVHLDQGQPGFPSGSLAEYFVAQGHDYRVISRDTHSVVVAKIPAGKTYCSLCSRLRRGILYDAAVELGATKLALGHHRDDIIETLLLNLFYSGQLKAMPPRLRSDDGRNVVIRPLAYCTEADLAQYAREQRFPVVPCGLCGSQPDQKRQAVKALIDELHAENPTVRGNMFAAIRNVRPSHLLDADLRVRCGYEEFAGVDESLAELGMGPGASVEDAADPPSDDPSR